MSYRIVAILSVHPSVTFRCSKKHKHYGLILYRFRDIARYWSNIEKSKVENYFITPVFDAPVTGIPVGISP